MLEVLHRGRWRRSSAVAAAAVALTAAFGPPASAAPCEPSTVALEHPQAYPFGEVLVFGPRGLIGGTAARPGRAHQVAVLWRNGRPALAGDLPRSFVADISAGGDVLVTGGEWPDGRALLISSGVARELPGLYDGGHVMARRLNDGGDIVGAASPSEGAPEVPVIWPGGGEPVALPLPEGAEGGLALGVNEAGDAVGLVFGPDMGDAYIWRADGGHERLDPGEWGEDPGFGMAFVIDDAGRAAGATGPLFAPGAAATLWTPTGRRVAEIEDGWANFYGSNDQGDFVGGAFDGADRSGTVQLLLMSEHGPPLTLLPLSGDLADEALAHAVSRRRHGDVAVGGFSTPVRGREPVATVWNCAYAQALPYDAAGGATATTGYVGRRFAEQPVRKPAR